jgi:hypothetical protein
LRPNLLLTPKTGESQLHNAAPNPAIKRTTIGAYIVNQDVQLKIFISIRDVTGRELYQSADLKEGENSIQVDLNKFPAGIYFYSLIRNGKAIDTKKLTIER